MDDIVRTLSERGESASHLPPGLPAASPTGPTSTVQSAAAA